MALQLGRISLPARQKHEIFGLMRTDCEKATCSEYAALPSDCVVADWVNQELGGGLSMEASAYKLLTLYPRRLRLIREIQFVQKGLRYHYDRLAPVSYTHLDVYKRQDMAGAFTPCARKTVASRAPLISVYLWHVVT